MKVLILGTRIIYDRSFLLKCRASPISNTPPSNLPDIPGVTSPEKPPVKLDEKVMEESGSQVGKENGGKSYRLLLRFTMPKPLDSLLVHFYAICLSNIATAIIKYLKELCSSIALK